MMVYNFFLFSFVLEHLFQKIKSKLIRSAPLCIYPFPEAELLGRLLYYCLIKKKKKKNCHIFQGFFCRLVRINSISSHVFGYSVSSDVAQWVFAPINAWANFAKRSANWKKPPLPRAVSFVARTADFTDNIISWCFQPRWWKWDSMSWVVILIRLKWKCLLSCRGSVICQRPLQLLEGSVSVSDSVQIITGQLKRYSWNLDLFL